MHHKLHFLDWPASPAKSISSYLLSGQKGTPFILTDTILVVPTAQSGRRLRKALADKAAEQNTGLLAGPVMTPFRLLGSDDDPCALSRFAETAFWINTLNLENCRKFQTLFPRLPRDLDFEWRQKTAELLIHLRAQLAEAGMSAADVAESGEIHDGEKRRWKDIKELIALFTARVEEAGFTDPVCEQLRAAEETPVPAGVRRVVLAACPELAPILKKLLSRWAKEIDVTVLVHASGQLAHTFDDWGCPKTDYWKNKVEIDLSHGRAEIMVAANEKEQAESVRNVLESNNALVKNGSIAVGVPDATVTPFLVQTLSDMGCPSYDPNGVSHRAHPVYLWVKAWRDLISTRRYESLRTFARHADVLSYVHKKYSVNASALLQELDDVQNERFPATVEDIREYVKDRQDTYPSLHVFINWVIDLMGKGSDSAPEVIRDLLAEMYNGRNLVPGNPDDDAFIDVARGLVDTLDTHIPLIKTFADFRITEWLDLLLHAADGASYYLDARHNAVELEGWLELPWNDASLMIITGMNDSTVPGGVFEDIFLPDSVRESLNIQSDASRTARDAYILYSLNEVRKKDGLLALIAGRQNTSGDVLKPSRLFWLCGNKELVRRAGLFFSSSQSLQNVPERAFNLKLDTAPPDDRARSLMRRDKWYVTNFKGFLSCPFRFYLSSVLEMESVRDDAEELDAFGFGTLVHNALESFGKKRELWASKKPEIIGAAFEKLVHDDIRHRFGRNPPMMVSIQAEAAIQRLKAYAYLHVEDFKDGWEVIDIERRFTVKVDDVEIAGKIDRIDRHPDGRLRVFDYKTYNKIIEADKGHLRAPRDEDTREYVTVDVPSKRSRNEVKMVTRHWADLQLPLYLHHIYETEGRDVSAQAGYVLLTKAATDVSIQLWEGLDRRLVDSAVNCARGIIHDAAGGKYGPPLIQWAQDDYDEYLWPDFLDDVISYDVRGRHD